MMQYNSYSYLVWMTATIVLSLAVAAAKDPRDALVASALFCHTSMKCR